MRGSAAAALARSGSPEKSMTPWAIFVSLGPAASTEAPPSEAPPATTVRALLRVSRRRLRRQWIRSRPGRDRDHGCENEQRAEGERETHPANDRQRPSAAPI